MGKLSISIPSQPEPIFQGILRFFLLVIFCRTQLYELLINRDLTAWHCPIQGWRCLYTQLQTAYTSTLMIWVSAGIAVLWVNTAATHPASCFCIPGYFRNKFELQASPQLYWLWKRNGGLKKHSTSLIQGISKLWTELSVRDITFWLFNIFGWVAYLLCTYGLCKDIPSV